MGENRNEYPTVAVLMSTYNGEKYIKEQLDSIFNQKEVYVTLYVRDDGSTDNTLEIIKAYHNDIILLPFDENKGPGLSFMTLLYHVMSLSTQYDYYAFADQDDIWMDVKLNKAIQQIQNNGKCVLCMMRGLHLLQHYMVRLYMMKILIFYIVFIVRIRWV